MNTLTYMLQDNLIKMDGGYYISDDALNVFFSQLNIIEDNLEKLIDKLYSIHELSDLEG